jgi:hypothetical protein
MPLQSVHATPIITKFGSGYADGKHNAQDTFHTGGQRDDNHYCNINHTSH